MAEPPGRAARPGDEQHSAKASKIPHSGVEGEAETSD
jgi:hypothetical protein